MQETRVLMLRRLTLTTRNRALPTGGGYAWASWPLVLNSARTAAAAVVSLIVARLFRLPEAYWAPITTLVITQSSLGAALSVSCERFMRTVLGAAVGAIVTGFFGPNMLILYPDANHGSWYEYHKDFVFETNRFLDESDRIATVTSSAAAD